MVGHRLDVGPNFYTDFERATITRDIFIPGPTQPGLSRSSTNRQNTQHFTILQSELALPSTGSWLPGRLVLWAAVFTFNPYLLISLNEIIDINNSFIDINKYGHNIHLY